MSDRAPIPALFFLTGELPIEARIHRDIFSILYNIWINPQTKINSMVSYLMENSPQNSRTWSRHIRNLAEKYEIEDLQTNLETDPPPKAAVYKENILTKIVKYHEQQMRDDASRNSKMQYFNVNLIGLRGRNHPSMSKINTTHEVARMRPHMKMLCGDYYTYKMEANYQGGSPNCRLCSQAEPRPGKSDISESKIENIEHILTVCSIYSDVRDRVLIQMKNILEDMEFMDSIQQIFSNNHHLTQFILDCTSFNLPVRIKYDDENASTIFALSRDLCFSINKRRLQMLKNLAV